MCEIKLTVEPGYPFTGGNQCSLEVRGDRDTPGTSVRGAGLCLRKSRSRLISLCVNLQGAC